MPLRNRTSPFALPPHQDNHGSAVPSTHPRARSRCRRRSGGLRQVERGPGNTRISARRWRHLLELLFPGTAIDGPLPGLLMDLFSQMSLALPRPDAALDRKLQPHPRSHEHCSHETKCAPAKDSNPSAIDRRPLSAPRIRRGGMGPASGIARRPGTRGGVSGKVARAHSRSSRKAWDVGRRPRRQGSEMKSQNPEGPASALHRRQSGGQRSLSTRQPKAPPPLRWAGPRAGAGC